MRRSPELRPTGWDSLVVLAVVVLAAASAWMVWRGPTVEGNLTAVVSVDGAEVERIDLEADGETRTYSHNGYTLTVNLRPDGEVGVLVETSDCPTQDCVHTGTITRAGQSIVCLPARIIIQLQGGAQADGDAPDVVIG